MAQEEEPILPDPGLEEQTFVLRDTVLQEQDVVFNTHLADLYNIFCNDKQVSDVSLSLSGNEMQESCDPLWISNIENKNDSIKDRNDSLQVPQSVSENAKSPVTHIEIIKSSVCRRVSGANRVVPLLTSTLKVGRLNAVTNTNLSEIYRVFLDEGSNSDNNRKCEMCQLECLSSTDLEYHVKLSHRKSDITPEQCFVCRKRYIFRTQLHDHLSHIHGIQFPELICKSCFMEFSTTSEQKAHERKHDQTYSCQMCNKKFASEYLCQTHLGDHLLHTKPYECIKCGKRFKNSVVLDIHERRHQQVTCSVCGIENQNELSNLMHIKGHNSDDIAFFLSSIEHADMNEIQLEELLNMYTKLSLRNKRKVVSDSENDAQLGSVQDCVTALINTISHLNKDTPEVRNGVECKICGVGVASGKELLEHQHQFHLRCKTCPFCGKRSRSVSMAWRHMKIHPLKESRNLSNLTLNQCDSSANKNILEANTLSNRLPKNGKVNSQTYGCSLCPKKFLYPDSRDNHVLQHSKGKNKCWKCTTCGLGFSRPKMLLKHMTSHEAEIKCQICCKTFSKQNALEIHMKTHFPVKGKKMYKCTLCSVECPTLSGLQTHHRCHTGERPYSCGECQRKFKRLQAVKKHIQVVHNSASLEYHLCSDCPKQFNSLGNLVRHYLRIHCQLRRFICGVCGSRFSQNQDLRKHFKITHKIEMPNIQGTHRKALREIYVIPGIDNFPESHPHAMKIKQIVAEEKAKFNGMAELLQKRCVVQPCSEFDELQFIQENPESSKESMEEAVPSLRPVNQNDMLFLEAKEGEDIFDDTQKEEFEFVDTVRVGTTELNSNFNKSEVNLFSCQYCRDVFVGENEYLQHLQDRSRCLCHQCGDTFCSNSLLEGHIFSQHTVFRCHVCMQGFVGKAVFVNHMQDVENIPVIEEVLRTPDDGNHVQAMFAGEGNNTVVPHIEGSNSITIFSNSVHDTSTLNDSDVLNNGNISRNHYGNNTSVLNNQLTGSLNINGILLQNLVLEPNSSLVQSLPLVASSSGNSGVLNTLCSGASLVTINTPSVPNLQQHTASLIPVKTLKNVTLVNNSNSCAQQLLSQKANISNLENVLSNIVNNNILSSKDTDSEPVENTDVHSGEISEGSLKLDPTLESTLHKNEGDNSAKHVCKICGESCANPTALMRHLKSHTDSKPFECPQCGKCFSEKHNLKMHSMTHTGERPYQCKDCGKQLRYRKDVADHKRMHLGEKPFACEECGRKFIWQRALNRHKVTHTGEKRYKCPVCGKAFGRLDQLKHEHLPTHENYGSQQQQHICQVCDKGFRLKSKLKQHEVLHTGVKKYQCHLCKKSFALESYLKAHIQSHKKRDSYIQCPKCPRRFITETTLQVHDKTFHGRVQKSTRKTENVMQAQQNQEPDQRITGNLQIDSGVDIQNIGLNILETDNCNTVIYLQMTSEDLKLALNSDA